MYACLSKHTFMQVQKILQNVKKASYNLQMI